MVLALGLALVLAIVWTDSCKRHLWESLGPFHHLNCDCRGYRFYSRPDQSDNSFSFTLGPPEDAIVSERGTLDMTVIEVAGPKARSSFIATQLGNNVHCTRGLEEAMALGEAVYQELRIPIPRRLPRNLHIYLYSSRSHLWSGEERLLAIAKVPLDASRMFGIHDVTVPFFNVDGEPAGHVRLVMRTGAPGSASLSTVDLVPYVAESSELSDDCCGVSRDGGNKGGKDGPIVVFSAGGKASIAVPIEKSVEIVEEGKDGNEECRKTGEEAENKDSVGEIKTGNARMEMSPATGPSRNGDYSSVAGSEDLARMSHVSQGQL